jgi:hypothetical protein
MNLAAKVTQLKLDKQVFGMDVYSSARENGCF